MEEESILTQKIKANVLQRWELKLEDYDLAIIEATLLAQKHSINLLKQAITDFENNAGQSTAATKVNIEQFNKASYELNDTLRQLKQVNKDHADKINSFIVSNKSNEEATQFMSKELGYLKNESRQQSNVIKRFQYILGCILFCIVLTTIYFIIKSFSKPDAAPIEVYSSKIEQVDGKYFIARKNYSISKDQKGIFINTDK